MAQKRFSCSLRDVGRFENYVRKNRLILRPGNNRNRIKCCMRTWEDHTLELMKLFDVISWNYKWLEAVGEKKTGDILWLHSTCMPGVW